MFGFGKKKNNDNHNGIPKDLYEFLEEADKLYIRAFETRSIGILKNHFTRDCCRAIGNWITCEASSRYFSDEKFRTTTWEVVKDNGTDMIIDKTCIYRDIKLTMSRTMKVSDDYKERWVIDVTPSEFMVSSVTPIQEW